MTDVERAIRQDADDTQVLPPTSYLPSYGATGDVHAGYDQHRADAAAADNTSAAAPSYDSIFGRVRAARAESTGFCDFLKKLCTILLATIGCTVILAVILAIPVSMIAIGTVYLNSCPYEHFIPIYLIVGGCFGVVKNLFSVGQRCRNMSENREDENAGTNPVDGILDCFLLAWFIAGSVWIYRSYGKFSTDPNSDDFCHPVLYNYAFWLTTSTYIVMAVLMAGFLCCVCVIGCAFGMQSAE